MYSLSALLLMWMCYPRGSFSSAGEGYQYVPDHQVTPDNHFNRGNIAQAGEPANSNATVPAVYGSRPIDIPFAMLNQGYLKFFVGKQLNEQSPLQSDILSPGDDDYANQTACGIPHNAYYPSNVAIHPFWLKFSPDGLGLKRYCMQDVAISIWNMTDARDGTTDILGKITDICCTDPADPSCCNSPSEIKLDRIKADLLFHSSSKTAQQNRTLDNGAQWPLKIWWYFTKNFQDGLPRVSYNLTSNWFANPPLPRNDAWWSQTTQEQYFNNQKSYPKAGWPTYRMGMLRPDAEKPVDLFNITNIWKPTDPSPSWCPVAGGKGEGTPPNPCP